ncbi:MAG: SEL1-like repeat protein, partial [Clostridia bacterium]|nr:SEL1-like repeat protein [Clostridia bacterium]
MEESFEELLQRAKNGDAEAQKEIGMRYYYGIGVEQNREVAAEWYMKAEMQAQMSSAQHAKSKSVSQYDDVEELDDEELEALEHDEDFARYMEEELKKLKSSPTQSHTQTSGLDNGKKGAETDKPAPAKKKKLYVRPLLDFMLVCAFIIFGISLSIQTSDVAKFFGVFIIIIGVFACVYGSYDYIKDKRERICPKCKEQYDYEDDIAYDLTDTVTKTYPYKGNGNNMHVVSAKLKYKFRVQCHCHNCNHTREYTKTVLAGKEYWDGAVETVDTEQALEKWYTQKSLTRPPTKKDKIIFGVITAILLWASLISFCFAGLSGLAGLGGFGENSSKDPKDYYGTYYGSIGGEYCYLTIDKDKNAVITSADGKDTV